MNKPVFVTEFRDVGAENVSFSMTTDDVPTESQLLQAVEPYLLSSNVYVDFEPRKGGEGRVYAGFHIAGRFTVKPKET